MVPQSVHKQLAQLTRIQAHLLSHLQRHIGGVITMFGVSGTLNRHRLRHDGGVQTALLKHVDSELANGSCKICWSHGKAVYGTRAQGPPTGEFSQIIREVT